MKKIITTVTLFLNLFIYSQNVGEQFFTEMLQYAEIEFQEMEDFTPIKVENKEPSYCYHPVLGCFYIMHKSFNKEKDVYAVYEVIPEKIDGKLFWGTDGNMPKKEYKSIEVKIRGKQVYIPQSAYSDLYESYLYAEFNSVYYDKDNDILYIVANNNYADRPYKVCWQIEKGVYKGRKVSELVY